jgi:pyruvate formate lyase activating enzyme
MNDIAPTPASTLRRARSIAMREGLRYVYTGNVHDAEGDTTRCPSCNAAVLERDWYAILGSNLVKGACGACGTPIAGRFGDTVGTFGRRRLRLAIGNVTSR